MALQTSAKINGFQYDSLYFSVVQTRKQKLYPKDEDGNELPSEWRTWVYVQAFADAQAKKDGLAMFPRNQVICLDGDIASADVDMALKSHKINMYDVDFSNATLI